MGIVNRLLEPQTRGRKFSIKDPDTLRLFNMLGWQSAAGIDVNPESALGFSAVYCATKLISETIGSLPLPVYERREDGGKSRAYRHPLYRVTHSRPNTIHYPMTFWTTVLVHLLIWGNFYAEIDRGPMEDVVGLWPLSPNRVKPVWLDAPSDAWTMDPNNPRKGVAYKYQKTTGGLVVLPQRSVFHVPGLGFDGLMGRSVIAEARQSIGLGIAQERLAGYQIQNGQRPGIALKLKGKLEDLSDKAIKNLKDSFVEKHSGVENAGKPIFLEEGMDMVTYSISPQDAQFLESRQFTIAEIARWFNMPPHKLKDLTRATFSNIEEQNIEWAQDTIRPWCVRIEQAITTQLFKDAEEGKYFAEFLIDALMRGNALARAQYYTAMINGGMMQPNEGRAKENFNPEAGLNVFWRPLNMMAYAGEDFDESELEPPPAEPSTNATRRDLQIHQLQLRSVVGRRRIRESYKRLFKEATTRVVRGERRNVMKGVKAKSEDALGKWLNDYYHEDHQAFIAKELKGVFLSLAEAIAPEAADVVNFEDDYGDKLNAATLEHLEKMAYRFAVGHLHKLEGILTEERSLRADEDAFDVEAAFNGQFDEWDEKAPDEVARWETVRMDGLVADLIWAMAGISATVWVSSANCCPWCAEMDGRTVDIGSAFLASSDSLKDGDKSFSPSWNVKTPPIHDT